MNANLAHSDSPEPPPKHSGGPRTPEGKEQSRRNALKRGLRSAIVFPDDLADVVTRRTHDFYVEFEPRTPYEELLVRQMAIASARVERCASLSVADLIRTADRAEYCWETDRRMSVDNYAVRLSKDPQRVARGLRKSRQGTDWLLERWEALGAIARAVGCWDDDQRRLAFDMLGIPLELRIATFNVPSADDVEGLIALVDSQIARLRDDQEAVLDELNDAERAMTMAGMPLEEDAATARLRKDECRARNDFDKARAELLRIRVVQSPSESRPSPQTSSDRPPLSDAAMEHLVQRSRCSMLIPDVAAEESATLPEMETGVVEADVPVSARRPLTRRARKELARRARAASRMR
jgi:hypothetical protein